MARIRVATFSSEVILSSCFDGYINFALLISVFCKETPKWRRTAKVVLQGIYGNVRIVGYGKKAKIVRICKAKALCEEIGYLTK